MAPFTPSEHIARQMNALADLAQRMAGESATIERIANRVADTLKGGGSLLFAGNGGSAADAQHLATEYVVRYDRDRRPYSAIALTTDTSLLTAAGNDLGFAQVFARQVRALGRPGDLLILHSTSGNSENLVQAVHAAREKQLGTVGFLGKGGGKLRALVDDAMVVPSDVTSHIQEIHLAIQHVIVELVERQLGAS
jgi:D-sedoheptulose 7-phosphate isomerase